jgi:hypothetical protein
VIVHEKLRELFWGDGWHAKTYAICALHFIGWFSAAYVLGLLFGIPADKIGPFCAVVGALNWGEAYGRRACQRDHPAEEE